jgi:uncharacterized protein involved in type VI secretion and phage assembly
MNLIDVLTGDKIEESLTSRVYGVVTGIVASIADPEEQGRVKVKFPWLEGDQESPWARVISFMAGKNRGAVFRPEVNDEVLVLFEHGDMRFPYVIGALWNGKDDPPDKAGPNADNHVRIIKSRSGHTITLDDTPGSEKVKVTDKNGNSVELSSSGIVIKSQAIKLGSSSASDALVLGDAFMELFNNHNHPTGVGPSGPPATLMVKGSHVSAKHTTE